MKQEINDFDQTICEFCGMNFNGPMKDKIQKLVEHHAKIHDERPSGDSVKRRRDY